MQENLILNQSEFDKYLNELAEMVIQQQDLQFDTHQEAQTHIENTALKLQQLLQDSNAMFIEGLKHLINSNQQPVSTIARQIHDHLHSPTDVATIIDTQIIKNTDALRLFSETVNSFYDCGDYRIEESVISVLLTLFPMEPQPFACYGTMIWRKESITEAVSFYEKIVDLFENPVLDYFAADCFYKSGNKSAAKKLLDRALRNAQESPQIFETVMPLVRILLKEF